MRNFRILAVLATVALATAGCKGDKGDPGSNGGNGGNGAAGLSALVATAAEPAGANCAAGGTKITSGIDANSNHTLDAAEVSNTFYVCNGAAGTGTNGQSSLIATSVEPAGANCANGGVKIQSGIDANGNGTLDAAEVSSTSYTCNGAGGTGTNSLIATSAEPAGSNCAAGGVKVDAGLDVNGNGALDAAEITATSYVCNGAAGGNGSNGSNGQTSLVVTTLEGKGANCTNGGVRIDSGLDANANGVLDAAEMTTRYVCNGGGRQVEACAGCHSATLADKHAVKGQVLVSGVTVTEVNTAADLQVDFNIKVDGVNNNGFFRMPESTRTPGTISAYRWTYDAVAGYGTRTPFNLGEPVLTSRGNGNYRIVLPGYGSAGASAASAPLGTTAFLFNIDQGNSSDEATLTGALVASVLAPYPSSAPIAGASVADANCMNCHGDYVFKELGWNGLPVGHHGANPRGVSACEVCHNVVSSSETRLGTSTATGTAPGTRLMGYVHGIHNSHNMAGAVSADGATTIAGGTYYRNGSATSTFSVGFPGYMNNCSTCHIPAALPAIVAQPVTWQLCMSCHVGPPTSVGNPAVTVAAGFAWAGFGVANSGTAAAPAFVFGNPATGAQNHAGFINTRVCANCHDGTIPSTLAAMHNGQKTERNGLIWDGSDVSVDEGAKFALAVTGVTRVGANYQVTWTASYNGTPVDPCNTDFAVGPVFLDQTAVAATGRSASNMQFVKAYGQPAVAGVAQGDDWVNANRTGTQSPGQPITGATLTAAGATPNTTCAANVATTTMPVDPTVTAPTGTKGVMALQGKPQLRFAPAAGTTGEFIQARAKSPTYNFLVPAADGAAPAGAPRRTIVDTAKCLGCHKGTLYQHGGNRVDNVDLCVTCHNPASNEKNVRVGYGVTAATSYDGQVGQTYDMRTFIHALHSAGESGKAIVIYRTRGIYFFGSQASLNDAIANKHWPTTGGVTCNTAEGPISYYPIYGSVTSGYVPSVNADGTCNTTAGAPNVLSTNGTWQTHNVVLVHYPQPLNNCGACHANGWTPSVADGAKAVAVTAQDAGGTPYGNQLDDVLRGPTAASCFSCHQSGDAFTQSGLQLHGNDMGWTPSTFVNGRQTLIDAAKAIQ